MQKMAKPKGLPDAFQFYISPARIKKTNYLWTAGCAGESGLKKLLFH